MDTQQVLQPAAGMGTGAAVEFDDPVRIELMQTLAGSVHREMGADLWAFLWLADVTKLQGIVAEVQRNSEMALVYLEGVLKSCNILREWTQSVRSRQNSAVSSPKEGKSTPTPAPAPATPPRQQMAPELEMTSTTPPSASSDKGKRSAKAADSCRRRDGNTCIVSRAGLSTEVAHIFPFAMRKFQYDGSLYAETSPWRILRLFWTDEKVQAWYDTVAGRQGTEVVKNLFCLTPSVDDYHTRAFFALKPIREDAAARTLTAKFYWLPLMIAPYRRAVYPAPSIPVDLDSRNADAGTVKLFDVHSEQKICSGDEIIINAKDDEGLPLPDFGLLELQWHLQRIVAMCGGAEAIEERYRDDDDDDDFFFCFCSAGADYSDDDSLSDDVSNPAVPSSPPDRHRLDLRLNSLAEAAQHHDADISNEVEE